jgi:hypothetical protein
MFSFALAFSINSQARPGGRTFQITPAKPCDNNSRFTTWKTIYSDSNGRGSIDISSTTGKFVFDTGGRQHNFRFCNRFSVPVEIDVKVVTDENPKGVMLGLVNVKPNSMSSDGGLWTISKAIEEIIVYELLVNRIKIIQKGKFTRTVCPLGKICVPAEITFPGKKNPS